MTMDTCRRCGKPELHCICSDNQLIQFDLRTRIADLEQQLAAANERAETAERERAQTQHVCDQVVDVQGGTVADIWELVAPKGSGRGAVCWGTVQKVKAVVDERDRLRTELDASRAEVDHLKRGKAATMAELDAALIHLQAKERTIKGLRAELEAAKAERDAAREESAHRGRSLLDMDKCQEQQLNAIFKRAELAEIQAETWKAQCNAVSMQLAAARAEVAERDATIERLQQQNSNHLATIFMREHGLAEKDTQIAAKAEIIKRCMTRLGMTQTCLEGTNIPRDEEDLPRWVSDTANAYWKSEKKLTVAQAENAAKDAQITALRGALERIRDWREHPIAQRVAVLDFIEQTALAALDATPAQATCSAPGHTDLMVSPEAIDKYLEKNPPAPCPECERCKELAAVVEKAHTEVVLYMAFFGRDFKTERFDETIQQLTDSFVKLHVVLEAARYGQPGDAAAALRPDAEGEPDA